MRVNRTAAGRGGAYGGRGRGGDGGYPASSRGDVQRGRTRAGSARESGIQRENGNTREKGYPGVNAIPRENARPREGGVQRDTGYQREAVPQRQPVYPRQSYRSGNTHEQYSGYERKPARRVLGGKLPVRAIAAVAVLTAVIALVFIIIGGSGGASKAELYSGKITSGVKINGQDVSGRDLDKVSREMRSKLQSKVDEISLTLTCGGKTWKLGGADLGVTDNLDEVMSKIALLARVGSLEQRRAEAEKYKKEGYGATVSVAPDSKKLKIKLNEIATSINNAGKDAAVSFNWLIEIKNPEAPTQEEINSMFTIVPETPGQVLDVEATAQKILEALKQNPKSTVEAVISPFVPKYTAEGLKKCRNLRSVFSTRISGASTKDRTSNVKLAISKFDGLTIWPGQELSFNDTTGPRTADNGYKMAHVISGGTYVDDWGGGVCQASTTIYNAIVLAGLKITDSGPHTIPSDYVKSYVGFDAMVNFGRSDLKFVNEYAGPSKNAVAAPIFLRCLVTKNNNVYVLVFGAPLPDGEKIERYSDVLYKGPLPLAETKVDEKGEYAQYVEYEDETYEVNKPHAQIKVDTYRIWKDQKGNELERELLRHDNYPEVAGLTVMGSKPRPASPTPSPDGTSKP